MAGGTRYIPATDYCPEGCFESDWSNFYTWHGQGLALGASEDDALYVWPGFMSNVTIKVRQAASEPTVDWALPEQSLVPSLCLRSALKFDVLSLFDVLSRAPGSDAAR